MQKLDRVQEAIEHLKTIVRLRGREYALGMCMGILARLARMDYQLQRELRQRAQEAEQLNKSQDN